jgi:hypothetical protein
MIEPKFGTLIRIKENCELSFCRGLLARVAYIGVDGISVYLVNSEFDDCIPLKNDEWGPADEKD